MTGLYVVSDLHGSLQRYEKLFDLIRKDTPEALFIGGDILPHLMGFHGHDDFLDEYLFPSMRKLKTGMGEAFPPVFMIPGNDDARAWEQDLLKAEEEGLWYYMHNRKRLFGTWMIYGYAAVPPTPFRLKDWERYDVSRFVDPGCIHPYEGTHTVKPDRDPEFTTIAEELEMLTGTDELSRAIMLFHTPPYHSFLDRAALDGMMVDHVPLDVHVGSIAVQRLIETRQPGITLHGHIHESSRITGHWKQLLGKTWAFNAAIDKRDILSVIRIDPENPASAERWLI